MNFSINREVFLTSLNAVNAIVVDKNSDKPILKNTLISVENGKLKCIATDILMAICVESECKNFSNGSICISAKELLERIKKMPTDSTVTVNSDGIIKCNKSNIVHKLPVLDGQDFPHINFLSSSTDSIIIHSSVLNELLTKTWFTVTNDLGRANTSNAYLLFSGELARVISFDGHRLTLAEKECKANIGKVYIPYKAILFIRKWLSRLDCDICIIKDKTGVCYFSAEDTVYSFLSMDIEMPDFDKIFSVIKYENSVVFSKNILVGSILSASLTDDKLIIDFDKSSEKCKLFTRGQNGTSSEDLLDCKIKGSPTKFKVDSKFLLESINVFSTSKIKFRLGNSPSDPIVLVEQGYKSIIAPIVA